MAVLCAPLTWSADEWTVELSPTGLIESVRYRGQSLLGRQERVEALPKGWASPSLASVEDHGRRLVRTFHSPSGTLALAISAEDGLVWSAELSGSEPRSRLEGVDWRFAAFGGFEPSDRVSVPGPFWPNTCIRPASALAELDGRTLRPHSTPDGGFGVLVRETGEGAVVAWFGSPGDCATQPEHEVAGGRLDLGFREDRAAWLEPGSTVRTSTFHIARCASREEALSKARSWIRRAMPPVSAPAWTRDAVILEAYPHPAQGGLAGITDRLEEFHRAGVDTLYLMPHWRGSYMPVDFDEVEPALGTEADLLALGDRARQLGMRLLFDLVIHGMSPDSTWVRERPDLFLRNADGEFARHRTWKSVSTDWSSPDYLHAMADLARRQARRYGIAGYRVDAAGFKGPHWHGVSDPASTGANSPGVMRAMLSALREVDQEAVLLSEVFGPVFNGVCDFTHDNQTEGAPGFLELLAEGKVDAEDYRRHMADVMALLSPDTVRVYYVRNHDTSWFYRFGGYTPAYWALEAVHAWCACPSFFSGDPEHGPNPGPIELDHWGRLIAAKRTLSGPVRFGPTHTSNRNLFVAQRGDAAIVVSLSRDPEPATLVDAPWPSATAWDPVLDTRETVATSLFDVAPYQALILTRP